MTENWKIPYFKDISLDKYAFMFTATVHFMM